MVCRAGQTCLIQFNLLYGSQNKTLTPDRYPLCESTRGKDLYDYIEEHCQIQANRFKLYLSSAGKLIDLSGMKDKTMLEVGVDFSFDRDSTEHKHTLLVVGRHVNVSQRHIKYGLPMCNPALASSHLTSIWEEDNNAEIKSFITSETCYVGLVNQAMTCYLNSLLQALYMTPEFRNALYNWEYVNGSELDEDNSIPYQLQKLFLNLQTSSKPAVETTALTKSFGWDSTEAWQQHDIQELCRVMFDALEQKFKNTEQADLINRLYEGMMTDYVKCLECGTEKSREDAFLDIPLPVRPFGSNVAYDSVEEALKAFVQYETLEGSNQYYCEKCNKKCNAHKGLKFTKFPYLLTFHLKRFDFDFKTFHRVKLNDKVTFPDILNLNSFISSTRNQESPGSDENIGLVKCDDGSTTDSGTLDDDYPPCENSLPNSNRSRNHDQDDDDEGIEISKCPSTSNCTVHNHENEKNHSSNEAKGPYNYELFSIMIHSGSASGGHYYVDIKDFRTQEWLCFNDQSVTQITHDDIQKTYGGGPTRPYYSGSTVCCSTNAYMLMYRQIDPARNALPMQVQDFPKHIQELLKKMKEDEDNDRKSREKDSFHRQHKLISCNKDKFYDFEREISHNYNLGLCKPSQIGTSTVNIKVFCHYSLGSRKAVHKLSLPSDVTLADATLQSYLCFNLEGVARLNQCRLVLYDPTNDLIVCTYEGREQETFDSICKVGKCYYFLLEVRTEDPEPQHCEIGGLATKVYIVDLLRKKLIDGPRDILGWGSQTVKDYKQMVGKMLKMDLNDNTNIVLRKHELKTILVTDDNLKLRAAGFSNLINVYISTASDTEFKSFHTSAICEIIDNYENFKITLCVKLPEMCKEILEEFNILFDEKCTGKEKPIANSPSKVNVNDSNRDVSPKCNEVPKSEKSNEDAPVRNASPQLGESEEWNTPEQSNSEDSSLSDSDKTLVGDVPEDEVFHVPYLPLNTRNRATSMLNQIGLENWDTVIDDEDYYFSATPYTTNNQKILKVHLDKRMTFGTFKKNLEPYVGVSSEYFKMYHFHNIYGLEWCNLKKPLVSCENGQTFCIEFGRALHSDEFKVIVYQFHIDSAEPYTFLAEWILSKDMTVGQAKKEILAEIKRKHNIDIPYERCRLREKCLGLASTVYLDFQKFEDFPFRSLSEIILQELPDEEPVVDSDQVVLFVKRWSPTHIQLGPSEEIVMNGNSVRELKKKLSAISDIPTEYIEVARTKNYFPTNLSILQIPNELEWSSHMLDIQLDFDNGSMFLYKDSREVPQNLTREEINDIAVQELSRFLPLSSRRTRKEKGLRIHLGTE
ncbi:ubiquitin carboxyl-terminal hydrolase 47-like isoform X2 [Ptiloglossa arizonensis]|uniref:ubiquitin carboxyl-terminal hydrolase 47-like isoform X2 n=1 Tax=Ptiloglossa arizonensis TaxID=3350558 RepID=UPI003F9FF74B